MDLEPQPSDVDSENEIKVVKVHNAGSQAVRDQFTPPDEDEGDDKSKYTLTAWWSCLQAHRFKDFKVSLFFSQIFPLDSLPTLWESPYLHTSLL